MRRITIPGNLKKWTEKHAHKAPGEGRDAGEPCCLNGDHNALTAESGASAVPKMEKPTSEEEEPEQTPVIILKQGGTASGRLCSVQIQASSGREMAQTAPLVAEAEALVERHSRRNGRDFLVWYKGSFIGVLRAPKRILNRTAYRKAAAVLREEYGDFDPSELALFRPVPLPPPPREELLREEATDHFVRFRSPEPEEA